MKDVESSNEDYEYSETTDANDRSDDTGYNDEYIDDNDDMMSESVEGDSSSS